jgi:hypothetical protein
MVRGARKVSTVGRLIIFRRIIDQAIVIWDCYTKIANVNDKNLFEFKFMCYGLSLLENNKYYEIVASNIVVLVACMSHFATY